MLVTSKAKKKVKHIGTVLLFVFPRIRPTCRISKLNGLIYVLLYGGYMVTAFLR